MATNHTITQSLFNSPCQRFDDSLDSGYWPNPNNTVIPAPQWDFTVQTTDPTWWFCAQGTHCSKGMVFAINPTAERTFEMFRAKAVGDASGGGGGVSGVIGNGAANATGAPPALLAAPSRPAMTLSAEGAVASKAVNKIGAAAGGTGGSCQCQCLCPPGSWMQAPVLGASASPSSVLRALPVPSTFVTSTTRRESVSTTPTVETPPVIAERLQAPIVTVPEGNARGRGRLASPSPSLGGLNLGMFTNMKEAWTVTFVPPPSRPTGVASGGG